MSIGQGKKTVETKQKDTRQEEVNNLIKNFLDVHAAPIRKLIVGLFSMVVHKKFTAEEGNPDEFLKEWCLQTINALTEIQQVAGKAISLLKDMK